MYYRESRSAMQLKKDSFMSQIYVEIRSVQVTDLLLQTLLHCAEIDAFKLSLLVVTFTGSKYIERYIFYFRENSYLPELKPQQLLTLKTLRN